MLYLHSKTAFSSNNLIQRIIDRAFGKGCVVVEHMVAAVVVVLAPAVVCAVARVPDVRKGCHRGRLLPVDLLQKPRVNRAAVAAHPAPVKVQGIRNQALMACHDVGKVAERLRRVAFRPDVDVDVMNSFP